VELQWHRLWVMETRKGRRWGAADFGGEEREEARWFHSVGDRPHNEERLDGEAEGGDLRLEVKDDQRKLGQWAECVVGPNY
jgi:hypothetical protein